MPKRKLHLEALRVIAIFFVVMNHTGTAGQLYYLQIHDQPVHWLLMGFSALHKAGTTILLVEQNAEMALSIADRAYVMETGRITLSGTGKELAASEEVQKAYLGG